MVYTQKIPTERVEGIALAQYLRYNRYRFAHIANESGLAGNSWNAQGVPYVVVMQQRKRAQGTSVGFPDYVIACKYKQGLIFLELKRPKRTLKNGKVGASPSKVSPEQIEWINTLNYCGDNITASIVYGADEAIEFIKNFDQPNEKKSEI